MQFMSATKVNIKDEILAHSPSAQRIGWRSKGRVVVQCRFGAYCERNGGHLP
jgi:hypothetical protein